DLFPAALLVLLGRVGRDVERADRDGRSDLHRHAFQARMVVRSSASRAAAYARAVADFFALQRRAWSIPDPARMARPTGGKAAQRMIPMTMPMTVSGEMLLRPSKTRSPMIFSLLVGVN